MYLSTIVIFSVRACKNVQKKSKTVRLWVKQDRKGHLEDVAVIQNLFETTEPHFLFEFPVYKSCILRLLSALSEHEL